MLATCIELLHRHPLELRGLPASVIVELGAYAQWRDENSHAD